jgi:hypothetical protein
MDAYRKQHIAVQRPDTLKNADYVIGAIMRTEVERAMVSASLSWSNSLRFTGPLSQNERFYI